MRRAELPSLLTLLLAGSLVACTQQSDLSSLVSTSSSLSERHDSTRTVRLGQHLSATLPQSWHCASDTARTLYLHEEGGRITTLVFAQSVPPLSSQHSREQALLTMAGARTLSMMSLQTLEAVVAERLRDELGEAMESDARPSTTDTAPGPLVDLPPTSDEPLPPQLDDADVLPDQLPGTSLDPTFGRGLGFEASELPDAFEGWRWLRSRLPGRSENAGRLNYRFARIQGTWTRSHQSSTAWNLVGTYSVASSDAHRISDTQIVVLCQTSASGCTQARELYTLLSTARSPSASRSLSPCDGSVTELAARYGWVIR